MDEEDDGSRIEDGVVAGTQTGNQVDHSLSIDDIREELTVTGGKKGPKQDAQKGILDYSDAPSIDVPDLLEKPRSDFSLSKGNDTMRAAIAARGNVGSGPHKLVDTALSA